MSPVTFLIQAAGVDPLPAEAPISGPMWSVVLPALLLLIASCGTFLLYRRFTGDGADDRL
jgi:hypothetical protein